MPWVTDVGANVTWTLPVEGIDLSARLSVYNLFNNQKTINVHQRYEAQPGQYREATFAQVTESCVVMAALGIVVMGDNRNIEPNLAEYIKSFKPRGIIAHFVNFVHRDRVATKS